MSYPLCMKLQSFFFVLIFVSCTYLEKWRNESISNVTCINNKKRRKSHLKLLNSPCLLIETWRQSITYWPIVIIHPCLIAHPFSKSGDAQLVILNPAQRAVSRGVKRSGITIGSRRICTRDMRGASEWRQFRGHLTCGPSFCDFSSYNAIHVVLND